MMEWFVTLMTLFIIALVSINNLPQTIVSLVKTEMIGREKALFMIGISAAMGYMLQGSKVTYTIAYSLFRYDQSMFVVGALISAMFLILSTVYNLATSIQQLMILSLFGIYYASAEWINMKLMFVVLFSWILNMGLTVVLVLLLNAMLKRLINSLSIYDKATTMRFIALLSSVLLAYAMGANTFGTIASVLGSGFDMFHSKLAVIMAVFYGVLMFNVFGELKRSKLLESFDSYHVTCAQMGCGISVILFSFAGIPVSIIHALVSGLLAIAFIKKMRIVERKVESMMFRNLLFVPLLSLGVGLLAGFLFF